MTSRTQPVASQRRNGAPLSQRSQASNTFVTPVGAASGNLGAAGPNSVAHSISTTVNSGRIPAPQANQVYDGPPRFQPGTYMPNSSPYAQQIGIPAYAGPPRPAPSLTDELIQRILHQLMPLFGAMRESQLTLAQQNVDTQNIFRSEITKLREDMARLSENAKKREDSEANAKERNLQEIQALKIIADRMGAIQRDVARVGEVVGKSSTLYGPKHERGLLEVLETMDMNIQEWVEKARDPSSNDSNSPKRDPTSQLPTPPTTAPAIVRHEMATSPFRQCYANAAVSQTPTPDSPTPLPRRAVSVQVSPRVPSLYQVSPLEHESPPLSDDAGSDRTLISERTGVANLIAGSAVTVIENTVTPAKHATMTVEEEDPFQAPKNLQPEQGSPSPMDVDDTDEDHGVTEPIAGPSSITQVASSSTTPATPSRQSSCSLLEPQNLNRSPAPRHLTFSPVDWSKATASSTARVPARSTPCHTPKKAIFPPTIHTPSPRRSYSLPQPPEGSVAALRQEALGAPYLDGFVSASRPGSPLKLSVVPEASSEEPSDAHTSSSASASEEDPVVENVHDLPPLNPGRALLGSTPKVVSERRSPSVESSLTSLSSHGTDDKSSNGEIVPVNVEPVPITVVASPASHPPTNNPPPSQASAGTADEEAVRTFLVDLSPIKTQPSTASSSTLKRTSTLESWLQPTELLDSPRRPGQASQKPGTLSAEGSQSGFTIPPSTSLVSSLREWHNKKRRASGQDEAETNEATPAEPAVEVPAVEITQPPPVDDTVPVRSSCSPTPMDLDFDMGNPTPDSRPPSPSPSSRRSKPREEVDDDDVMIIGERIIAPSASASSGKALRRSPSFINISSDSDDDLPKPPPKRTGKKSDVLVKKEAAAELVIDTNNIAGPSTRPGPLERSKQMEEMLSNTLSPTSDLTSLSSSSQASSVNTKKKILDSIEDDDTIKIVPKSTRKASTAPASTPDSRSTPTASDAGSSSATTSTKKSLLVMPKQGQSNALTRIKKRKSRVELLQEDEPPLKKVRMRSQEKSGSEKEKGKERSTRSSSTPKATAKDKSPVKQDVLKTPTKKLKRRAASLMWPQMKKPTFDQFIQCDGCSKWYHVGCVGVHPDDIRLSDDQEFKCPPCGAGVQPDGKSPSRSNVSKFVNFCTAGLSPSNGKNIESDSSHCSRPKCLRPEKKGSESSEEFEVESLVGLWKKSSGGTGMVTYYLVKWEGYGFNEASWQTAEDLNFSSTILTTKLEEDAEKEDLELDNTANKPVYLKVASRAGWRSDGTFRARKA